MRAAARTQATRGFAVAVRSEIEIPGLGHPVVLPTTGRLDPRARRGALVSDMGALVEASSGKTGDYRARQVLDGDVMYAEAPWLADSRGRTWMKATAGSDPAPGGSPLDRPLFGQIQQAPLYLLDQLRFPLGRAELLGHGTVQGTRAIHYRVSVDMTRWAARPGALGRADARSIAQRFTAITGSSRYPADVWVDRAGLVRRAGFRLSFEAAQVPSRPRIGFAETLDLHNFGIRVTIRPPRQDQISRDLSGG